MTPDLAKKIALQFQKEARHLEESIASYKHSRNPELRNAVPTLEAEAEKKKMVGRVILSMIHASDPIHWTAEEIEELRPSADWCRRAIVGGEPA